MIRTQPVAGWRDMRRPVLAGASFALAVPFVLGIMAAGIAVFIRDVEGTGGPALFLAELSVTLYYSPVLALPAAVISLPLVLLALKNGYAGWGAAMVFGAALGLIAWGLLAAFAPRAFVAAVISGVVWAGLYWTGVRLFAPWAIRKAPGAEHLP